MKFIDRTGEENISKFGSKMIITKYISARDIDVYFPEYNWTSKHNFYNNFKNGLIKCPYEPRVYGHGYMGEGKYKSKKNGKHTRCYQTWHGMLERCYDPKYHKKEPAYKDCEVCDEWLNFQNFAKWFYKNYYEVLGERMHLDKDILVKHNKLYSPETCIFVPQPINSLFTKRKSKRGSEPIGVSYRNDRNKYRAYCDDGSGEYVHLGHYNSFEEAFQVYKQYKENLIKKTADKYKDFIPEKLYKSLYKYEVEIND